MERRQLLKGLAGLAACPLCLGAGHAAAQHWSYRDVNEWGGVCSSGGRQSPVDIVTITKNPQTPALQIGWAGQASAIKNNGHTIEVACGGGMNRGGAQWQLLQFHFHHPSEHLLSGKAFDLELHFVHKSAAGRLAVLGVFIQPGAENAALTPIWAAMPKEAGDEQAAGATITPGDLLPADRGFFRYHGSLTTPPCSEGVLWTVFKSPIEASPAQIRQFAALFPVNARPAQPLNQRFLLESL